MEHTQRDPTVATGAPETTSSQPDFSDDNLPDLTRSAKFLREETRRLERRLSSHRSIEHLLPRLIEFESAFQETVIIARRTETEDYQREPLRKLLRRTERLRERVERLVRRARCGRNLVEGLLACEEFRRELFGDLFCREFEELSLGMRGGEDEREKEKEGRENAS